MLSMDRLCVSRILALNRSYPLYFIAYSPMITAWCNHGVIFGICSSVVWLRIVRGGERALEKTPLVYFYWDVEELLNKHLSLR